MHAEPETLRNRNAERQVGAEWNACASSACHKHSCPAWSQGLSPAVADKEKMTLWDREEAFGALYLWEGDMVPSPRAAWQTRAAIRRTARARRKAAIVLGALAALKQQGSLLQATCVFRQYKGGDGGYGWKRITDICFPLGLYTGPHGSALEPWRLEFERPMTCHESSGDPMTRGSGPLGPEWR